MLNVTRSRIEFSLHDGMGADDHRALEADPQLTTIAGRPANGIAELIDEALAVGTRDLHSRKRWDSNPRECYLHKFSKLAS